MSIAEELAKLADLHHRGALSDEEFARAKAALLSGGAPAGEAGAETAARLARLERQDELDRLDRDWQLERERYMVKDRYGRSYVPTRGNATAAGVALGVFGTLWTVGALFMAINASRFVGDHPMGGRGVALIFWIFPVFGVVFVTMGIVMSVRGYRLAEEYERAHRAYRRRRQELTGQGEAGTT